MDALSYWEEFKNPFAFVEFFMQDDYCQGMLQMSREDPEGWKGSAFLYAGGIYSCMEKYPRAFTNIMEKYMEYNMARLQKFIDEEATA